MGTERKVVVVTGASHGLGEAFVKAYRHRGWRAVGNAKSIAPSSDPDYITVQGDIGEPSVARKVVQTALDRFGRIDTLINNAGIWRPGRIEDISEEVFREVMRTNLDSVFFGTQAAVPAMKRQGGGTSFRFRRAWWNTRCRPFRRWLRRCRRAPASPRRAAWRWNSHQATSGSMRSLSALSLRRCTQVPTRGVAVVLTAQPQRQDRGRRARDELPRGRRLRDRRDPLRRWRPHRRTLTSAWGKRALARPATIRSGDRSRDMFKRRESPNAGPSTHRLRRPSRCRQTGRRS